MSNDTEAASTEEVVASEESTTVEPDKKSMTRTSLGILVVTMDAIIMAVLLASIKTCEYLI